MDDIVILETTDDLQNGIDLANGGEKFVAEARASAGTFNQSGNIDELDGGGDEFLAAGDARALGEARIRHGDDPFVGIDGAEWIVGSLRFARAGDGIEEC